LYLRHLFLHEKMSGGNCALSGTAMQSYLRISPTSVLRSAFPLTTRCVRFAPWQIGRCVA
jgi:hypothetical protein